jgi:methionyl-tRNA formyltransferase
MRLIFMGTPDFAAVTLRRLIASGHDIACVYSQPPRPAGRGYALKKSPVHEIAEGHGIEVRTPVSLKSHQEQERFAALNADAAIVVAYGLLLPKPILDAPKQGCFNIHASLLPRWRGAAPIQRAIMSGDTESGITIMRMDEGLDTGPMMIVVRIPITPFTTAAILHDQLAEAGAAALLDVLASPLGPGVPQPADGGTYAGKIDKAETKIDFGRPALEVRNHIHGLSPFPGAWMLLNGVRVKVLTAEICNGGGAAGVFLDDDLTVACGAGALRLLSLQREGKGVMDAQTFLRGFPVTTGTRAG